jgi:Zn-dependent protease
MPGRRPSRTLRVASIAGIDLRLDASWIVSLVILSYYAYAEITRTIVRSDAAVTTVAVSVALGLALVLCILAHELAHSLVARGYGLPVRGITLFAFGGVSQIEREAPDPASEYMVALAGPLMSIVIATVLGGVARLLNPGIEGLHGPWGAISRLNLWLAIFNLIPAFPMDGGRILRSLLWVVAHSRARATRWAANVGRGFATFLIASGVVVFGLSAIRGNGAAPNALWATFIGMFLYNAASASARIEGGERPDAPPPPTV